jgi:hypothetical protein
MKRGDEVWKWQGMIVDLDRPLLRLRQVVERVVY